MAVVEKTLADKPQTRNSSLDSTSRRRDCLQGVLWLLHTCSRSTPACVQAYALSCTHTIKYKQTKFYFQIYIYAIVNQYSL